MKQKTVFVCGECGYETPRWMGKCPQCGSWNTIVEEERVSLPRSAAVSRAVRLGDVTLQEQSRISTGIGELDRVLGGGLTSGMTVLMGGSPGIGKSTLLLQCAHHLCAKGTVLYASGEESRHQIRLRADRLGLGEGVLLLCENAVEAVLEEARSKKADFLIIDSIQTMFTEDAPSAPGSVTQIRSSAAKFTRFAKETGTPLFLVGHVTKEGALAGPKVLEHIVDTVLYFEGDRQEGLRLLRSEKNRFGSTNELGVFEMTDKGMAPVPDPSGLFLSGKKPAPGCAVGCIMEGSRPLLTEIQSLLCPSAYASPRRTALGMDVSRFNMLLAVLERRAGLKLSDKDGYLSTSGNLRLQDRGADLAAVLCLASASCDTPLPPMTAAIGEVGLTGDVRPVGQMAARLKECQRLGYTTLVVPQGVKPVPGLRLIPVNNVLEAVSLVLYPGEK
ncbi:MAG: DNA repair protein RadA [Clostridia bacterium]|nr:DNA repair protein RadA [Clostridia bacterium]